MSRNGSDESADVVIVGGGLAGSLAACVLGRRGLHVTLIDRHETYPADFRAEQIVGAQADQLRRLGLLDNFAAEARPVHLVTNARAGRLVDRSRVEHYGLPYEAMVAAARGAIPETVELRIGRVTAIETGPERQHVRLAGGETVEGRLVVLATGFGATLREALGIRRRVIRDAHSLTLGFDILPGPGSGPLTYYGSDPAKRADYLTVFPLRGTTRVNLFAYRDIRDPWTRVLRTEPERAVREAFPGVERFLGDFRVDGPVQVRVNDLHAVEGHVRDGVVLIGDAFQTSCPAAGTGITRLLSDIERLAAHLPGWLETSGMGTAKIGAFYEDPEKRAVDARALHVAEYMRKAATETTLRWSLHRRRVLTQRRLRRLMVGMAEGLRLRPAG